MFKKLAKSRRGELFRKKEKGIGKTRCTGSYRGRMASGYQITRQGENPA
jgi:hypothetical protein